MAQLFTLDNGLRGVCETIPGCGKVTVSIGIKGGANNEAAEENGLTQLMVDTMIRGTKTRSRDQIAEETESKGSGVGQDAGLETISFAGEALTRNAAHMFDVLSDVILNPSFDPKEIDFVRKRNIEHLDIQLEDPGTVGRLKLMESIFGDQNAGKNIVGAPDLIRSFTPEQVRKRYDDMIADPSRIVISFAGDIDAQTAEDLTKKYFSSLAAKPLAAVTENKNNFIGGDIRESTDNKQLSLRIALPAPDKNSTDRFAGFMLQELLAGSMSAPLFQEIRVKRGLVYTVGATYAPMTDTGVFTIMAGTGKGKAGELVAAALDLLGATAKNGYSAEEIETARIRMLRERKDVSVAGHAAKNAGDLIKFGRLIPEAEFEHNLKQVTGDDIRRFCGDMLHSGKYALSAVGPQDTLPMPEEIRALIAKQLDGLVLPPKQTIQPSIRPAFAEAAARVVTESELKTTILPNGLKVISLERPGNLSCGIWVGVGADNEPKEINGASHMMEHMMFKGTPSYPAGEVDRLVEKKLHGGLNAYTSHDRTCYYFYNLDASALPTVVDLCGEMVFMADISDEQFDGKKTVNPDGSVTKAPGERDVVLEEIKRSKDNLTRTMFDLVTETAFPDQPQGRTVLGPSEIIANMTAQEMRDYRDIFYVPNNAIFCAVGPVKHDDLVAEVSKRFGQLPAKPFPDAPLPTYVGGVATQESVQAQVCSIVLAAPAPAAAAKEEIAYTALSMILGDGSSARLNKRLVEQEESAMGIDTGCISYRTGGTFLIVAKTKPEKTKSLVRGIYEEVRGVKDMLTEAELTKIKFSMEMKTLGQFESNDTACNAYARMAQDAGRTITLADIAQEIQELTVEDVKRAAEKILEARPTGTFIVPKGTDTGLLPTMGELIAARDGIPPGAVICPAPGPLAPRPANPAA